MTKNCSEKIAVEEIKGKKTQKSITKAETQMRGKDKEFYVLISKNKTLI